jgi:hypothetical protein
MCEVILCLVSQGKFSSLGRTQVLGHTLLGLAGQILKLWLNPGARSYSAWPRWARGCFIQQRSFPGVSWWVSGRSFISSGYITQTRRRIKTKFSDRVGQVFNLKHSTLQKIKIKKTRNRISFYEHVY